jgi:hypothetical protein
MVTQTAPVRLTAAGAFLFGGVWAYISPSRLNLWLRCPLAFKITYIDGIRTPTSASMFIGKQVHAALETHYRHRQLDVTLPPEQVIDSVADSWDEAVSGENVEFKSSGEEMRLKQQTADLVKAYMRQVPADEPRPLAVEGNEPSRAAFDGAFVAYSHVPDLVALLQRYPRLPRGGAR